MVCKKGPSSRQLGCAKLRPQFFFSFLFAFFVGSGAGGEGGLLAPSAKEKMRMPHATTQDGGIGRAIVKCWTEKLSRGKRDRDDRKHCE